MGKITWKTEIRGITELKFAEYNPRQANQKEVNDLNSSLTKFNLADPIIINTDNTVIGGHFRVKILLKKGIEKVDVRVPSRLLTKDEEKELNLRLNKNLGSWNYDLLANFSDDILMTVGFDGQELDRVFQIALDKDKGDDVIPASAELTEVAEGDLFQLGKHRIICGDSSDPAVLKKLVGNAIVEVCLTDPPYNLNFKYNTYKDDLTPEEYKNWCIKWFGNIEQLTDKILITPGLQNLGMWYSIKQPRWILEWIKRNAQSGCCLMGFNRHEPILFYNNSEPVVFYGNIKKRVNLDIYDINEEIRSDTYDVLTAFQEDYEKVKKHSCPKPIKLFAKIMKDFTNVGDVVLDIFLGYGTSLIAAEKTRRICYGVELDTQYVALSLKRWEMYTGLKFRRL